MRLQVQATSDWTTASLLGTRLVTGRVSATSGNVSADLAPAGLAVHARRSVLGGGDGGSAVADLVFEVPAQGAPSLQVCKGRDGSAQATVQRATDQPADLLTLDDKRTDDGNEGGCENPVTAPVAASALLGPAPWPARLDSRRLTLAFYYPWYSADSFATGRWTDQPEPPFNTDDPGDVGRMLDEAKGGGVDGFVVSYHDEPTEVRRLDLLARAASQRSFVVTPLFELDRLPSGTSGSRQAAMMQWFVDVLGRAAAPEYLKVGGRPVVFLFHANDVSPQVWQAVRQRLRAQGADPFVVGDVAGAAYDFDGLYTYSPNGAGDDQLGAFYDGLMATARFQPAVDPGAGRQQLWAAPVSPGEDDSALDRPPDHKTVVARRDGARYDATWDAAAATTPEWTLVTTWNEWYEDTAIAPSVRTGSRALDQTASWSTAFHTAG